MYKSDTQPGRNYIANPLETFGDLVLKWFHFCWSVTKWGCPVVLTAMYRKGIFSISGIVSLVPYSITIGFVIAMAAFLRTVGRYVNKDYQNFLAVLSAARKDYNADMKRKLRRYDFEFRSWPVDYEVIVDDQKGKKRSMPTPSRETLTHRNRDNVIDKFKSLPCQISSYISAHTFGIRMVYPGKTALINALVGPPLLIGRTKLVEEKRGLRAKVKTENDNEIDTMFVDRRNNAEFNENGKTLVICSEGNAGFYEIGCMVTPLDAGYSVLGWNHPGFAGSSGIPFPAHEQAAIDGVVQYAINELGFQPEDIVLFAWSIGGYPAAWAAMTYPDIKHVVLDATFDDILPLALARMPQSFESLVHVTIRKYINLDISSMLNLYPGPVLLVRRSRDEMITTIGPNVISSNRANDLLLKLLQQRYPNIVDKDSSPVIRTYLCKSTLTEQADYLALYNVSFELCESLLKSYVEGDNSGFPVQFEPSNSEEKNQLALFLASKYMTDFEATHCVPLPSRLFKKAWSIE